ncbi:hypothetical protein SmJEL517_g05622 [Synchytrium microbalum]|uniref:Acetyl-CoA C-acetyltransferase n=1 Tax=Synchytrium microbalum TaxID=1806994 RepID=A0A507BKD0_9FUNG|nr:uncharacterized protein SmJEL517_g05622 [Synchytrium microbalum]TPX30950.1 hypothetical protein SmJEL517_g05622 [Synchytrium microbalum]
MSTLLRATKSTFASAKRSVARAYSTQANDIVIVSAVRSPIVVKAAVARANIAPEAVEDLLFGNVISSNVGQAPARQVVIKAGLPVSTEATTINKVCASGMKTVTLAATQMMVGLRDVCVAGGMESMSNIPYYVPRGLQYGHSKILDGIIRDGLWDAYDDIHMGNCAEMTAVEYKVSREEQDEHALESYRRAAQAWKDGLYANEIVPITVKDRKGERSVTEDEEYKNLDVSKVPKLKSAFQKGGSVTAANSSKINDGAAALVLMTASKAKELNVTPLARILSFADAATSPKLFTIAPSLAIPIALKRAGLQVSDVNLWEINEAFSVVIRANEKIMKLDPSKVNARGGGVALGHPIGASGARIVVSLVHALSSGQIGGAAICM